MTFQEFHRIIETARKHSEPVVDLANELASMLEEDIGQTIMNYQRQIAELKVERDKAVEFAAKNDTSLELEEVNQAYHDLGKKYDELMVKYNELQEADKRRREASGVCQSPEKENGEPKKRRGRPKKDEVRALAEELARGE